MVHRGGQHQRAVPIGQNANLRLQSTHTASDGSLRNETDRNTNKNAHLQVGVFLRKPLFWLREKDLNLRPLGYEPNELPDCSIAR